MFHQSPWVRTMPLMPFFFIVFPFGLAVSDTGASMRTFLPQVIEGWNVEAEPRFFSGREIFSYMDGAGEVYLAYHYTALLVQRYLRAGQEEILVEIFDMGTPESAFGISTYMRGRGPAIRIGQDGEYKSGLITFWRGRYYVCVRVEKENPGAARAVRKIGRVLADAIGTDGTRPGLLRCLPEGAYRPESLRYFFRDEILRAHITLPRDDLFQLTDSTEGLLVRMRGDRSKVLVVRYPDTARADSALRSFAGAYVPVAGGEGFAERTGGAWVACRRKEAYVAAVIDAPTEKRAASILASVIRRLR